jgi:gamma-glutamyl-gamma-aminobutyrate hydrolase PuuD
MGGLGAPVAPASSARPGQLPAQVTARPDDATEAALLPPAPRKRPITGITKPERGDVLAFLAMKVAVWLAGGDPVEITARAPRDPRSIDGLIFGGGADVYPERFQGQPKSGYRYDLARGDMEASWALAARRHRLPVLGVCRGAQMLNVLAGGTLHMDLTEFKAERHKNPIVRFFERHPIRIRYKSKLAQLTRCTSHMKVNAIHLQAIDRLGAGLTVSAREPNGVIQGVEDQSRSFWLGVQFHPEFLIYRAPFRRLFKALVDVAGARAEERRLQHVRKHEAEAKAAARAKASEEAALGAS